MAEWLIAPVLKTGIVRKELSRVRIPLSPFLDEKIYVFTGNGSARWDSRARKKKRLDLNELKRNEKRILFS